ncbi:hypothetical protein KDL29_04760 [bacterium]|nr:hypothetical protein [bacterium]
MRLIALTIVLVLTIAVANAEDCCPGLRSSEGDIQLGLDHVEIAVADRDAARELWEGQFGFRMGEWKATTGGVLECRIWLRDGSSIALVYCETALDRRAMHYADMCAQGGGPVDVVLTGTELEHIRYALEAVEEPLEFIDHRTSIELTRPRDEARQPLRFVQHLLGPLVDRAGSLQPNEARGISEVWLQTDDLARDLLLLELLGGAEAGETNTLAGKATIVEMDGIAFLLFPARKNGLIGLQLEVADLSRCLDAMQLSEFHSESGPEGPVVQFVIDPALSGGIWLEFTEQTELPADNPGTPRNL